jgi:hypothetical protein
MSKENTYTFSAPQRALFLNVFDPKSFMKNGKPAGEPMYSATFAIAPDSPEVDPLKKAMVAAARAKWPTVDLKSLHFPLQSGQKAAEKAAARGKDASIYKDVMILKTRSKFQPALAVLTGGKIVPLDTDTAKAQWKSKFYNGCYGGAMIALVAYEGDDDEKGITAYLQSFLWTKDGPRIGGLDPAEAFKSYVGTVSNADPFGGEAPADDDIPF